MLYLAKNMVLDLWQFTMIILGTVLLLQKIYEVLTALDIDLYTHVTDNKEADDIFRSFFYADVPEIEASTDLALAEVMYRAAWKYKVKYVLEGHSFMEEGITPVGKNYFDGKYIKTIHNMYGKLPMKSYPLMTLTRFLFWTVFAKIQKLDLLVFRIHERRC